MPEVRDRRPPAIDNAAAIDQEKIRTLGVVGVGAAYVDKKFSDYPDGERLLDVLLRVWTGSDDKGDTPGTGRGITLVGDDKQAPHLHAMITRAAHLCGMPVLLVGLVELAGLIQNRGGDDIHPLDGVQGLFIGHFREVGRKPLLDYQAQLVEEYLMRHWDDRKAVFPWWLGSSDDDLAWHSESLLLRLEEMNERFVVRNER